MTPAAIEAIKQENRDLRIEVTTLKAALAAQGAKMERGYVGREPWAVGMTPQQLSLVVALREVYPQPISRWDLLDTLPGYKKCKDRDDKIIAVIVHWVRKHLGQDAIENVRGIGYALTKAGYSAVTESRLAAAA